MNRLLMLVLMGMLASFFSCTQSEDAVGTTSVTDLDGKDGEGIEDDGEDDEKTKKGDDDDDLGGKRNGDDKAGGDTTTGGGGGDKEEEKRGIAIRLGGPGKGFFWEEDKDNQRWFCDEGHDATTDEEKAAAKAARLEDIADLEETLKGLYDSANQPADLAEVAKVVKASVDDCEKKLGRTKEFFQLKVYGCGDCSADGLENIDNNEEWCTKGEVNGKSVYPNGGLEEPRTLDKENGMSDMWAIAVQCI